MKEYLDVNVVDIQLIVMKMLLLIVIVIVIVLGEKMSVLRRNHEEWILLRRTGSVKRN